MMMMMMMRSDVIFVTEITRDVASVNLYTVSHKNVAVSVYTYCNSVKRQPTFIIS